MVRNMQSVGWEGPSMSDTEGGKGLEGGKLFINIANINYKEMVESNCKGSNQHHLKSDD